MLLLKERVDMSDFGKNVIPNYLESGESVYACNLMATGKMLVH